MVKYKITIETPEGDSTIQEILVESEFRIDLGIVEWLKTEIDVTAIVFYKQRDEYVLRRARELTDQYGMWQETDPGSTRIYEWVGSASVIMAALAGLEPVSNNYRFVPCPTCSEKIWGTDRNIDSGLRKHMDTHDQRE